MADSVHSTQPQLTQGHDSSSIGTERSGDFAKIVRVASGEIVLFYKDNDDEGRPILRQITSMDGITGAMNLGFDDDDAGWDKRDAAYARCDVKQADALRALFSQAIAKEQQ